MLNGTDLLGDPSSTQSAIVVPHPGDVNKYYIFTVDTPVTQNNPATNGFNYSIVDMTLDGGLGGIDPVFKNINLLPESSEKVTAVLKDCQTKSIWVITYAPDLEETFGYNTFYAYEVDLNGLNELPVASTFPTIIEDQRGYLKLSPDGTKLVSANSTSGLYIYDFDKTTGNVSNETPVAINFSHNGINRQIPYGVEFSQNNKLLYVATYIDLLNNQDFNNPSAQYGAILQYDLTATDISQSEVVIDNRITFRSALQLGLNGKIYRSMSDTYNQGLPYLSVINNPNNLGVACNYTHNSFQLSRNSRQGLPPFITSFFSEKIDIIRNNSNSTELLLCYGDTYTLQGEDITGATYTWRRNGNILPETSFIKN